VADKFKVGDTVRLLEDFDRFRRGHVFRIIPVDDSKSIWITENTAEVGELNDWGTSRFELVNEATQDAIEWDGKGLPPVGTVCEVMVSGLPSVAQDWEQCTILLINEGADGSPQICTKDHRGDLAIYYPKYDAVYFRPLRTPEQIAMEKTLEELESLYSTGGPAAIYDAGYRK